jgi:multiple sugar transport system permease protein
LLDSERLYPLVVGAALVYLLVFIGYPFAYNLLMSFQEVQLGNLASTWRPFAGLDNYREVTGDPLFWRVVGNTIVFVGGNVLVSFVLGLALALFFDRGFPGAAFFRGLLLAAWVLPPMVVGAVFKWILATEYGVLNEALSLLGLIKGRVHWIADPDMALVSVTLANVWYGTPFTMILLAAGLATLPQELYEAAALDGAGRARRFVHVTAPLLMPTMLAVIALTTIYTLRVFDLIWTMTRGGPVDATNILPLWSFLFSFELFKFGHGAVVASLSMLVVLAIAAVYVRSLRHEHGL